MSAWALQCLKIMKRVGAEVSPQAMVPSKLWAMSWAMYIAAIDQNMQRVIAAARAARIKMHILTIRMLLHAADCSCRLWHTTWNTMAWGYARLGEMDSTRAVIESARRYHYEPDSYAWAALVLVSAARGACMHADAACMHSATPLSSQLG